MTGRLLQPLAFAVAALLSTSIPTLAQRNDTLRQLARGAASVASVVVRDAGGATVAAGAGVFTEIGRLVVPRALLAEHRGTAAVVWDGHDRAVTAVLADDPRSGLVLVAVDLPDGAPPAIRARTERSALPAGTYRAIADDGTTTPVEVGGEQDVAGVGPVCHVSASGPLPLSGSPVVAADGEMVGILLERSAGAEHVPLLVPASRVLALPPIAPIRLEAWVRAAPGARTAEAEAAFLRGIDASLDGKAAEAANGFRQAAAGNATDADAHAALAASELAAGRRDAAMASYRQAIAAAPDNPRFHHDLGIVLSDANRWEEAAREFAEVARLRPSDPEAQFNAGTAYGHAGRLEDEYHAYRAALAENPAHVNAMRNLGIACIALKRYDEAISVTTRALSFRPSDARLHAQLGVAYYDKKEYPPAIAELETAVQLEPDFAQAHYGLAVAYAAIGRRDAAQKECDRLKALDPDRGAEVARLLR